MMNFDYEEIERQLQNYGRYILTIIKNNYSVSMSEEQKDKLNQLLEQEFIVVNKPCPEDLAFFSKLHHVNDASQFSERYIPSAHGGRTKDDGKIHFYPYTKAYKDCKDTKDVIKNCLDNILTHEIFHYFIQPNLGNIQDPYKDDVQSFLTEGLVQKYTEDFHEKYLQSQKPKSEYHENVKIATQLLNSLQHGLQMSGNEMSDRRLQKELNSLVFQSNRSNILEKSSIGNRIYQECTEQVILEKMWKQGQKGQCSIFEYGNYEIHGVIPSADDRFQQPYLLIIPKDMDPDAPMIVETNNLEDRDMKKLLNQASLETAKNLIQISNRMKSPIMVPILPGNPKGPYYQQLSEECFTNEINPMNQRMDLQVTEMIASAKERILNSTGVKVPDKIFMNGYSASGVFAQRFALLHPELIDTLCVGGASGSIPMPNPDLDYPLGIRNYKEITGHEFDYEAYLNIRFRYYVSEFEKEKVNKTRFTEDGAYAPMHDMSYFSRSVSNETGQVFRNLYGKDLLERSYYQIMLLQQLGFDIQQQMILGKYHNNINQPLSEMDMSMNEEGVYVTGNDFVRNVYQESMRKGKQL